MQSRFLRYFNEYKPVDILKDLTKGEEAKQVFLKACLKGRLDVVAWLINEGEALPTTLDSRFEEQYPLLAKFLGSCGALNQPVDSVVTEAIAFRALSQNEPSLFDCVSQRVTNPHDFVPLALARANKTTAQALLDRKQEVKKENILRCSNGYWAAIHTPKMLETVCLSTHDWITTLTQLSLAQQYDAFEKAYELAIKKDPSIDKLFFDFDHVTTDEKLSDSLNKLMQALSQSNSDALKKDFQTTENYYAAFMYAYSNKNYVALQTLLKVCDNITLLKMLNKNNESNCILFLLTCGSLHLFDVARACTQDSSCKNLIHACWGSQEILNDFVKQLPHFHSAADWQTQEKASYLKKQIQLLDRLNQSLTQDLEAKRCYNDRTDNPAIFFILNFIGYSMEILGFYFLEYARKDCNSQQQPCQDILAYSISGIALGFFMTCAAIPCWKGKVCKSGDDRFQQLKLNQYSVDTQSAAREAFDEFAEVRGPLIHITLEDTVADVHHFIKRVLNEKRTMLADLGDEKEHIIDFKQVAYDEPESSPATLGLFSRNQNELSLQNDRATPLLFEYKRVN